MKNCGGGAAHRRQPRHGFLAMQRRKTQLLGPGSSWMARWSYYGLWLELKGTGAGDPWRSRGRRAAEQGGRGAWASVAAAGVRVRVQRGSELPFVGRRSNTGARARGEKAAGDLGVVAR
jgi:hypothetical protein